MTESPNAIAPLQWKADEFTGDLIASDTEGNWEIGPVFMTSCPIRFRLTGWDHDRDGNLAEAYENADIHSVERHRLANLLGYPAHSQATAKTQDDAVIAIEALRSGDPDLKGVEFLLNSGFRAAPLPAYFANKSARVLSRKSQTGKFTIEMVDDVIRLEHDRRGNSTTLLRFLKNGPTINSSKTHFWPDHIELNFETLAVQAAIKVADAFIASGRIYPTPRATQAIAA